MLLQIANGSRNVNIMHQKSLAYRQDSQEKRKLLISKVEKIPIIFIFW